MTKKLTILFLISLILISFFVGCGIAHYRYFSINQKGGNFTNGFYFDIFVCGFNIEADISSKENRQDSTFQIWFGINSRSSDCDSNTVKIYDNLNIERMSLLYNNIILNLSLQTQERFRTCNYYYYYKPVVIPSKVDSLFLQVSISYLDDEERRYKDTTVLLYRHEGKNFYMTN